MSGPSDRPGPVGETPDEGSVGELPQPVMDQGVASPVGSRGRRRKGGGKRGGGRGEQAMVPDAEFTSYYGRPVVRASPWEADIPLYLFLGGVASTSSLLAAGCDLTGRTELCRASRITATVTIGVSFAALVHDLGRPARFHHMLRVAKYTSPMSVGTWLLSAYAPFVGIAVASEARGLLPAGLRDGVVGRVLPGAGRAAGVVAALVAPTVASYTAVLLADTATPSWHEAYRQLPFVFVGSAAAAGGGMGLVNGPLAQTGPAQRMAVGGAVLELVMSHRMEAAMGLAAEPLHQGRAGSYYRAAKALTAAGAVLAATVGRRHRAAAVLAGATLVAGSFCTRFAVFHAGQQSAKDPRYTITPQRQRVDEGRPVRFEEPGA